MTGFGRSSRETPFGRVTLEIQSVNRKHLEVFVSLPKELGRFELEFRKWVAESISRGQVSVRLFLSPSDETLSRMLPDVALVKSMKEAWSKLAQDAGFSGEGITLPFLMQYLPTTSQNNLAGGEEEYLSILKISADEAIAGALVMKRQEGVSLAADIAGRLSALEKIIQEIEKSSPDAVAKQRDKLRDRMEEVLQPGLELDDRLLREIAFFAERLDIAEEITRFVSHVSQFNSVLQSKDTRVGRKLEFLVQEMGREINTIGSKSADAAISHLVVNAKSELEKVREQIQNVE
jgi:uncharacterized protein (TIGR00255 family)